MYFSIYTPSYTFLGDELFGKSPIGNIEYLGTYGHEDLLLEACDQYEGMGYKTIKYCVVK